MKKHLLTATLGMAIALSAPSAFAQTKSETAPPAPTSKAMKPAEPAKGMPMYVKVDEVDAKAMTFTHMNKGGKKVVFMVTSKTTIMNGDKTAKFEDIKVGDHVSGLRMKKSETEYEVVKITKFGPEEMKPAETKKSEAKPK